MVRSNVDSWLVCPRAYRKESGLETDSPRRRPRERVRWRTAAVLAVVAGFFALTLVSRWHQVTAVKWSLAPGYFAVACLLLASSYALVAGLWAVALAKVAATPVAAGVRIWFLANLARYVPGNVWSFVGAVELARREGAPRRTTLAVMALTQALSVGVALVVVGWRPLERLARRRFPESGLLLDRVLHRGAGAGADAAVLPPLWATAGLAGGYAAYWGLTGLAVAAYAAAYAVGFLSLLTPAGLGVREGVLVLALGPVLPAGPALVVALVSRLWMMVFELLGATVAYLLVRALRRDPARAG